MAIIDDLANILGNDAVAKIKADPTFSDRFKQVDELEDIYYGEGAERPGQRKVEEPAASEAPAARAASGDDDLRQMVRGIVTKLDGIPTEEKIKDVVNKTIEARANEFLGSAAKLGLQRADELNRIYRQHERDFGEELDTAKFNEFIEAETQAGRTYPNVPRAYDAFVGERRTEVKIKKGIDDGVRAKLKERATQRVPGVTPSGARSPLSVLMARGKNTDEGGATVSERAGAELDARLAAANGEV